MLHARKDYQERIQDLKDLIPEDEPVFLLRAQDVTAPEVVRYWIELAEDVGAGDKILNAAKAHVVKMVDWQRAHGMKIPDMP